MPSQPTDADEWIRARMEDLMPSVKAVSDMPGASRQTIYTQMQNRHPPTADTQRGLAIALRVKPDWYDRLMRGVQPVDVTAGGSEDLEARVVALEARLDALEAAQATNAQFAAAAHDDRKPTEADIPTQTFTRPHPRAEDGPHLED